MLLTTIVRELLTSKRLSRVSETDLLMESDEAVSAFVRAGQQNGILSGVHTFYLEQACKMIRAGDRVLDLGCGPALLLSSIAKLNPDATFLGLDYSAAMIEAGTEQLSRSDLRNVKLHIEDMSSLASIEPGSVDVVLSSMALHHLADTCQLKRCFAAIERVLAPEGRVFLADFGRLRSVKSVDYFVSRAIPHDEPQLETDYRASLRAAFNREELTDALPQNLRQLLSIYATAVSPVMFVMMSPFPAQSRNEKATDLVKTLPRERRADYLQLNLSLRLGGMPAK